MINDHWTLIIDHSSAVGPRGFDPPTSWSRTRRANRTALRPEIGIFPLPGKEARSRRNRMKGDWFARPRDRRGRLHRVPRRGPPHRRRPVRLGARRPLDGLGAQCPRRGSLRACRHLGLAVAARRRCRVQTRRRVPRRGANRLRPVDSRAGLRRPRQCAGWAERAARGARRRRAPGRVRVVGGGIRPSRAPACSRNPPHATHFRLRLEQARVGALSECVPGAGTDRIRGAAIRQCVRTTAAVRRRRRRRGDLHRSDARGEAGDDLRRRHQDARLHLWGRRRGRDHPGRLRTHRRRREPGLGTPGLGPRAVSRSRGCDQVLARTDIRARPARRHRAQLPRSSARAPNLGLEAGRGSARRSPARRGVERALKDIAARFAIGSGAVTVEPFTGPAGHINASYVVRSPRGRFFLQRLNTEGFRDHQRLMENVARVTSHLAGPLRLVPARDGASSAVDDQGGVWRMYTYIENGVPVVGPPSGRDVGCAAGAFGAFQRALADLPGPRLHETIPHFHDTPRRLEALERAVESDAAARAASVRAEIDQIRGCRHLAPLHVDAAARGAVPERVVHNDAKLANVLFDAASGDALCVVDLDTVMPGLALYDFGDLVRSMATRAAEDERDIGRVRLEPELFESVACGYLAATRELLTQAERELLVPAAQVIVYEQAARFLIDHLEGDRYYRIARPGHNLDRCRTQLALLDALRAGERALQQIVTHM